MAKAKPKDSDSFRGSILLAVTALVLFVAGEAVILARTDAGRLTVARFVGSDDPARSTQLVARQVRHALEAAGVPADSVREETLDGRDPRVRWRVGLRPGASALQVNYAITRTLETQGGTVFSGREEPTGDGGQRIALRVGVGEEITHEIVMARPPRATLQERAPAGGRVALILYGFGDEASDALRFFDLPRPFAVALPPGRDGSETVFRAAREEGREIVLHLPLEPINYPQMNPGPGALLVTMKPSRVSALTRKYLDQAGPVSAVANLMGSMATQDMTVMTAVFRTLRERGVPFLHVSPAAGAVCRPLASDVGVEYVEPDQVIDAEARGKDARALDKRWARALEDARRRGDAIVMLRGTDLVLEWLPGALATPRLGGVEIVPLTALVRRPLSL